MTVSWRSWKEARILLVLATLALMTLLSLLPLQPVQADQIINRSLTLQAGSEDGGSAPGGEVNHFFEFEVPSTDTEIASIEFLYCTEASGSCETPDGLDTTGASLGTEEGLTGWDIVADPDGDPAGTDGAPYLTRDPATEPSEGELAYQLQDIINPDEPNETFFVRISTYESDDASGEPVDDGVVAASTATEIELVGVMPESLIFCTGETIDVVDDIPDCSTATDGDVDFNQLFSATDTATATSQMAATTNADNGYVITVNGSTLTSGSNEIDPMEDREESSVGTGQFGMNLRENTTDTSDPEVGDDVTPEPDGELLKGQPTEDYGEVDEFKFEDGDAVAASDNDGAGPTNSQRFTKSYIVNVSGAQPAGTYTTTLTYISTATF